MKTFNNIINLFEFSELSEEAQTKAIYSHYNFLNSQGIECENEAGQLVKEEYKPTPNEVIENIEVNEYLFYKSGVLAHTVKYVIGYDGEKAGKTFFINQDKQEIEIKEPETEPINTGNRVFLVTFRTNTIKFICRGAEEVINTLKTQDRHSALKSIKTFDNSKDKFVKDKHVKTFLSYTDEGKKYINNHYYFN